jgi:hypothetical protein
LASRGVESWRVGGGGPRSRPRPHLVVARSGEEGVAGVEALGLAPVGGLRGERVEEGAGARDNRLPDAAVLAGVEAEHVGRRDGEGSGVERGRRGGHAGEGGVGCVARGRRRRRLRRTRESAAAGHRSSAVMARNVTPGPHVSGCAI